ncbi:hypothetical protein [Methanocalculus taiwanensis]|uniref:hypothetical protein n=1 Tax=Methanocalculus taiwanensis TaxID=106207 RepID=UPI0021010EBE|nr:hypothetical protein [Methanocalculus taiwanensis]
MRNGRHILFRSFLSAEKIPGRVVITHPVFGSKEKIFGCISGLITPQQLSLR